MYDASTHDVRKDLQSSSMIPDKKRSDLEGLIEFMKEQHLEIARCKVHVTRGSIPPVDNFHYLRNRYTEIFHAYADIQSDILGWAVYFLTSEVRV